VGSGRRGGGRGGRMADVSRQVGQVPVYDT
jgi:hypothetical protein